MAQVKLVMMESTPVHLTPGEHTTVYLLWGDGHLDDIYTSRPQADRVCERNKEAMPNVNWYVQPWQTEPHNPKG